MSAEVAMMWAVFGYGTLALVLATWAAYELAIKINARMGEKQRGRHRR